MQETGFEVQVGMTVEEICQDRNAFAKHVQEISAMNLNHIGLEIVLFTIKDIYADRKHKERVDE